MLPIRSAIARINVGKSTAAWKDKTATNTTTISTKRVMRWGFDLPLTIDTIYNIGPISANALERIIKMFMCRGPDLNW